MTKPKPKPKKEQWLIKVVINGVTLRALADTGARPCVCGKAVGLRILRGDRQLGAVVADKELVAYNGITSRSSHLILGAEVKLRGAAVVTDIILVPKMSDAVDVIISRAVMSQLGYDMRDSHGRRLFADEEGEEQGQRVPQQRPVRPEDLRHIDQTEREEPDDLERAVCPGMVARVTTTTQLTISKWVATEVQFRPWRQAQSPDEALYFDPSPATAQDVGRLAAGLVHVDKTSGKALVFIQASRTQTRLHKGQAVGFGEWRECGTTIKPDHIRLRMWRDKITHRYVERDPADEKDYPTQTTSGCAAGSRLGTNGSGRTPGWDASPGSEGSERSEEREGEETLEGRGGRAPLGRLGEDLDRRAGLPPSSDMALAPHAAQADKGDRTTGIPADDVVTWEAQQPAKSEDPCCSQRAGKPVDAESVKINGDRFQSGTSSDGGSLGKEGRVPGEDKDSPGGQDQVTYTSEVEGTGDPTRGKDEQEQEREVRNRRARRPPLEPSPRTRIQDPDPTEATLLCGAVLSREEKLDRIKKQILDTASDYFSDDDKARMVKLYQSFADVLAVDRSELKIAKNLVIDVELKPGAKPVRLPPRRYKLPVRVEIEKEVQELLRLGHIRDVTSEWSCPVVAVRKPDGSIRLCQDLRQAHTQIMDYSSALALPDTWQTLEDLAAMGGVACASLDIILAFSQAQLSERAQKILTFITDEGTFAPVVAPFGLKVMPGLWHTFARRIAANSGLACSELKVFADDFLWAAKSVEGLADKCFKILQALRVEGIVAKLSKIKVLCRKITALGYEFECGSQKLTPTADRVKALVDFEVPRGVKGARSWLGSINWLRRLVPGMAALSSPISRLLRPNQPWVWGPEQQESFEATKKVIASGIYVVLPKPDQELRVKCDASALGWSAALEVEVAPDAWAPAVIISKAWSEATKARHMGSTEAEARGALEALRRLRPYLYCRRHKSTDLITDHAALSQLVKCRSPKTSTLARLALEADDLNVRIVWKPGKFQEEDGQDGCSRYPVGIDLPDTEVGREVLMGVVQEEVGPEARKKWRNQIKASVMSDEVWDTIAKAQIADPQTKVLIDFLNQGGKVPEGASEADLNFLRLYSRQAFTAEGLLYINVGTRDEARRRLYEPRLWIPPRLRQRLLEVTHCGPMAPHRSGPQVAARLADYCFYPELRDDADYIAKACLPCVTRRPASRPCDPLMGRPPVPDRPFTHISIDILKCSHVPDSQQNTKVLAASCYTSKFLVARALRDEKEASVMDALLSIWCTYLIPEVVFCDNGAVFRSGAHQRLAELCGYRIIFTNPSSPSSQIERSQQSLLGALAKSGDWKTWSERLQQMSQGLVSKDELNRALQDQQNKMERAKDQAVRDAENEKDQEFVDARSAIEAHALKTARKIEDAHRREIMELQQKHNQEIHRFDQRVDDKLKDKERLLRKALEAENAKKIRESELAKDKEKIKRREAQEAVEACQQTINVLHAQIEEQTEFIEGLEAVRDADKLVKEAAFDEELTYLREKLEEVVLERDKYRDKKDKEKKLRQDQQILLSQVLTAQAQIPRGPGGHGPKEYSLNEKSEKRGKEADRSSHNGGHSNHSLSHHKDQDQKEGGSDRVPRPTKKTPRKKTGRGRPGGDSSPSSSPDSSRRGGGGAGGPGGGGRGSRDSSEDFGRPPPQQPPQGHAPQPGGFYPPHPYMVPYPGFMQMPPPINHKVKVKVPTFKGAENERYLEFWSSFTASLAAQGVAIDEPRAAAAMREHLEGAALDRWRTFCKAQPEATAEQIHEDMKLFFNEPCDDISASNRLLHYRIPNEPEKIKPNKVFQEVSRLASDAYPGASREVLDRVVADVVLRAMPINFLDKILSADPTARLLSPIQLKAKVNQLIEVQKMISAAQGPRREQADDRDADRSRQERRRKKGRGQDDEEDKGQAQDQDAYKQTAPKQQQQTDQTKTQPAPSFNRQGKPSFQGRAANFNVLPQQRMHPGGPVQGSGTAFPPFRPPAGPGTAPGPPGQGLRQGCWTCGDPNHTQRLCAKFRNQQPGTSNQGPNVSMIGDVTVLDEEDGRSMADGQGSDLPDADPPQLFCESTHSNDTFALSQVCAVCGAWGHGEKNCFVDGESSSAGEDSACEDSGDEGQEALYAWAAEVGQVNWTEAEQNSVEQQILLQAIDGKLETVDKEENQEHEEQKDAGKTSLTDKDVCKWLSISAKKILQMNDDDLKERLRQVWDQTRLRLEELAKEKKRKKEEREKKKQESKQKEEKTEEQKDEPGFSDGLRATEAGETVDYGHRALARKAKDLL